MSQPKQENGFATNSEDSKVAKRDLKMELDKAMDEFRMMANVDGRSESTLELYDYVFGRFTDFFSKKTEIGSISPKQIRKYLAKLLEEDLKRTSVAIHHRVLNAFFNWLLKEGFLKRSPTKQIDEPRTPNKYPKVLNKEQVEKLLKAAKQRKDSWTGYRNYVILLLFIDTGIRRGELIHAKMKDLDLKRRSLKVHGKGAKDRKVYFGPKTFKALRQWRRIRSQVEPIWDDTIFISSEGRRLKPRNLQRRISVIQKNAGLEDVQVSPHVFRHTSATLAVENGLDAFSLQRMFGWEQLDTAMRYVHMSGKKLEEATRDTSPVDSLDGG